MIVAIVWVLASLAVSHIASTRDRSAVGWLFLSLCISPLLGAILLVAAGLGEPRREAEPYFEDSKREYSKPDPLVAMTRKSPLVHRVYTSDGVYVGLRDHPKPFNSDVLQSRAPEKAAPGFWKHFAFLMVVLGIIGGLIGWAIWDGHRKQSLTVDQVVNESSLSRTTTERVDRPKVAEGPSWYKAPTFYPLVRPDIANNALANAPLTPLWGK